MDDGSFVKLPAPVTSDGFKREYQPVAIVGNKKLFSEKEVKTFYHTNFKEALSLILGNCLDAKSKVLYIFDEKDSAFDIDPQNTLAKRKISVTYMAKSEDLIQLTEVLNDKCL